MGGGDVPAAVQIGDSAGHPEDTVIAPGGEAHAVEGPLHQPLAGVIQGAEPVQALPGKLGVAEYTGFLLPGGLEGPGPVHPLLHLGGGFRLLPLGQLVELQGGSLDEQVQPVQEGAGQPGEVLLDRKSVV